MKTFQQFRQDINEAVPLAIPTGIALKTAGSKFLLPALMTGIGAAGTLYQATKKINNDKGEEEIKQRKRAEEEEVGKAIGMNPGEELPPVRKRDIIKQGFEKYKEGLRVAQNPTVAKKYRTPEMKGKRPADIVREILQKQKQNMKDKRAKNREIDDKLK
tara:strand:- start:50 stop:526 length:477 start_codon:yes stop_codon:yes gene_type:complete